MNAKEKAFKLHDLLNELGRVEQIRQFSRSREVAHQVANRICDRALVEIYEEIKDLDTEEE